MLIDLFLDEKGLLIQDTHWFNDLLQVDNLLQVDTSLLNQMIIWKWLDSFNMACLKQPIFPEPSWQNF